jgi:hypothetical protein
LALAVQAVLEVIPITRVEAGVSVVLYLNQPSKAMADAEVLLVTPGAVVGHTMAPVVALGVVAEPDSMAKVVQAAAVLVDTQAMVVMVVAPPHPASRVLVAAVAVVPEQPVMATAVALAAEWVFLVRALVALEEPHLLQPVAVAEALVARLVETAPPRHSQLLAVREVFTAAAVGATKAALIVIVVVREAEAQSASFGPVQLAASHQLALAIFN